MVELRPLALAFPGSALGLLVAWLPVAIIALSFDAFGNVYQICLELQPTLPTLMLVQVT